jgi:hypothetical protein
LSSLATATSTPSCCRMERVSRRTRSTMVGSATALVTFNCIIFAFYARTSHDRSICNVAHTIQSPRCMASWCVTCLCPTCR